MSLHLYGVPQQGFLEQLESANPRDVSDASILEFAQRMSGIAGRFSECSRGDERHAFSEIEYGAECLVDHFTPAAPSAIDQIRHNNDMRRKMDYEEAAR